MSHVRLKCKYCPAILEANESHRCPHWDNEWLPYDPDFLVEASVLTGKKDTHRRNLIAGDARADELLQMFPD